MRFNPDDLFPLLLPHEKSYTHEQIHSQKVDEHLGLKTVLTEETISNQYAINEKRNSQGMPTQYWIDLPVEALLTPYSEIREILEKLNPQKAQTVIDLGAGYGRMGFVMAKHFPHAHFIGYEVISERVNEGSRTLKKHGCTNAQLLFQDLTDPEFTLPRAEYYFLYDFGSKQAIRKILNDLQIIARTQPITVIGRGRSSRDTIEKGCPWLSQVHPPQHFEHYSVYKTTDNN